MSEREKEKTIGQKIASLRKQKGMSQEELGNLCGVSRQSVSKWEADAALPDVDKLIRITRVFGISLDELFGTEKKDISSEKQMEEILHSYTGEQKNNQLLMKIMTGILLLVLCGGVGLFKYINSTNQTVRVIRDQLSTLQTQFSMQKQDMEKTLESFRKTAEESFGVGSGYQMTAALNENKTADVKVSVIPRYDLNDFEPEIYALSAGQRYNAKEVIISESGVEGTVSVPFGTDCRFYVTLPSEAGNPVHAEVPDTSLPSVHAQILAAAEEPVVIIDRAYWTTQNGKIRYMPSLTGIFKDYENYGSIDYSNKAIIRIDILKNGIIFDSFEATGLEVLNHEYGYDFEVLEKENDRLTATYTVTLPDQSQAVAEDNKYVIFENGKPVIKTDQ